LPPAVAPMAGPPRHPLWSPIFFFILWVSFAPATSCCGQVPPICYLNLKQPPTPCLFPRFLNFPLFLIMQFPRLRSGVSWFFFFSPQKVFPSGFAGSFSSSPGIPNFLKAVFFHSVSTVRLPPFCGPPRPWAVSQGLISRSWSEGMLLSRSALPLTDDSRPQIIFVFFLFSMNC